MLLTAVHTGAFEPKENSRASTTVDTDVECRHIRKVAASALAVIEVQDWNLNNFRHVWINVS